MGGRPNRIDQLGLGPRVLVMATQMGSRAIAKVLEEEGHKISFSAVHRYLADRLEARREATEHVAAAVQEQIQQHVLSDVQMLGQLRGELALLVFGDPAQDVKALADTGMRLKAAKELRETLKLRIEIATPGGNTPAMDYRDVIREAVAAASASAPRSLDEINERFPLPPAPPH